MVSLESDVERVDGVTLVTARVEGAAVPTTVRLVSRLDGPVWPPRRRGVPEAGWDGDAVERTVPADGRVVVGFASPAPPVDPPVAVADATPVTEEASDDAPSARAVMRELAAARPPRDAVPRPDTDERDGASESDTGSDPGAETTSGDEREGDRERDGDDEVDPASFERAETATPATDLDVARRRVASAERLADAETVPTATAALSAVGGLDGARRLRADLDRDAECLRALANRAERLAERAEAAEVPLATLEALA